MFITVLVSKLETQA